VWNSPTIIDPNAHVHNHHVPELVSVDAIEYYICACCSDDSLVERFISTFEVSDYVG
jgi:hypothetical protein